MRNLVLSALVVVAACKSTPTKVPEGSVDWKQHEEYAEFRPVAMAVLPAEAPVQELRMELRREVYRRLFEKRYSPFRLDVVDAHVATDGTFDPGSLDWDATLEVDISKWKVVSGTRYFAGDGTATLRHRTGEVLWTCAFNDYAFEVPSKKGEIDQAVAARAIAKLLVDRMPERPPLPSE